MAHELSRSRYLGVGMALAAGLLLTFSLLVGLATAGEPAQGPVESQEGNDVGVLATTGSVTGLVTANSPAGPPLENATVYVIDKLTNYSVTTTTDANGHYSATITADSDAVKVLFVMTNCTRLYYNDKTSFETANVVSLTLGSVVTNINAALPQTVLGSISGVVTDVVTFNPLPTTTVRVYDAASHISMPPTLTDQSGSYTVTSVAAGSYKVGFSRQGYSSQYYAYTDTITQATVLTLSVEGVITDINGALGPATGCLTGMVTAGEPLDAVTVTVYAPMSLETPVTQTVEVTVTGVSGGYGVCGLNGYYLVGFGKRFYLPQWYDNQPSLEAADRVTVTDEYTTGSVNAALVLGGFVAGQVRGSDGITRPGAVVTVYNTLDAAVGYRVDPAPLSTETFRVGELSSGSYRVHCADVGIAGNVTAVVTATQETTGVICVAADWRYVHMPVVMKSP